MGLNSAVQGTQVDNWNYNLFRNSVPIAYWKNWGQSLVERSATECGVSKVCDRKTSKKEEV